MPSRRAAVTEDPDDSDSLYTSPATSRRTGTNTSTNTNASKITSATGSDKENRRNHGEDGGGDEEEEEEEEEEEDDNEAEVAPSRKDKGKGRATQALHERVIEEEGDKKYYDPDQKPEERRLIRKGLRELGRTLNENKAEYLLPSSKGLLTTITKANELFKSVKQTSDATLDSRILVDAADMAYSRAKALSLGSSAATGIDVDEFVGKLITYMRNSPDAGRISRRDSEEDTIDDGDALDWAYLGSAAAFKGNKRPATSDFLLGPLSVQKRQRIMKARNAALKRNAANIVRPQELKPSDIQQQESNSTTKLVMSIATILDEYLEENELTDEGQGVNYFRFVINPHSFAQTVENIFYVSFLVRDGRAALWEGDDGMPLLGLAEAAGAEEARERGVVKRQVITSVDMWMWKELIEVLEIDESIIPFREVKSNEVGTGGWYA